MAGNRVKIIYISTLLISLLMLGLYIVGTARYLTNVEDNTCEMTYMFEYPQYVRIALDEELEDRYPRFGLYAYGEGFVTRRLRQMKFFGIPILFVPGNGGSHEQVRSLASISLRKSLEDRTPFHFDYFTVSLGEDYSALYGGVLEDETTYVSLCMDRISKLYEGKVEKIVLVGHSMGGVIAKGALVKNLNGSASILLTMATPHRPIFLADGTIARYYEELKSSSHRLHEMKAIVVSIGGGERDVLVGSSQTIDSSADLNLQTSGMPYVWRSTDHLCILWCKQLILTIVRALFDCVDVNAKPPTISTDSRHKLRAFSYHLTSRISGKKLRPYEERYEFERGAEWIEDIRRQYTWTSNPRDSNKTVFLMIRLDSSSYDSLTIESTNLEAKDWVFACSAYAVEGNSRICEWGWNLTNRTSLSPDTIQHHPRKKLRFKIEDLRNYSLSHIVVRLPSSELRGKKSLVKIHVDLYRNSDRSILLREDFSIGPASLFKILRFSTILTPNPCGSIVSSRNNIAYHVSLDDIVDAVRIEIEPINESSSIWTKSKNNDENPRALFELFRNSSAHEHSRDQVRALTFTQVDGERSMKKVVTMQIGGKKGGILMISLGPGDYSYRITIRRVDIIDRIACLIRNRWPILYPITLALCLLGIATRIDDSPRKTAITSGITVIIGAILDCIFEIFVATALIHIFAIATCCLVVFFGSIARNIAARFLARIVALPNLWLDWLLGGLDRLPIVTAALLLSSIPATCGAIAILLSVALFFLKLTRMYDDYTEKLLLASLGRLNPFKRASSRKLQRESSPRSKHESPTASDAPSESTRSENNEESLLDTLLLFVTWSFVAIPAIPSALVWAKNFRYETRLTTEDPAMLFSWIILTSLRSLNLVVILPNSSKSRRLLCGAVLRSLSWIVLCTACLENSAYYQWLVPPLMTFCMSCVALLSLFP